MRVSNWSTVSAEHYFRDQSTFHDTILASQKSVCKTTFFNFCLRRKTLFWLMVPERESIMAREAWQKVTGTRI